MHDKFKKRNRAAPREGDRLRLKIAAEAARRLYPIVGPAEGETRLREASEADYYTAKRKAAAVLGLPVRPGDLPTDSQVRDQVLAISRAAGPAPEVADDEDDDEPSVEAIADHVDRFAIYKMRLDPLALVKQNVKTHPEGDALYHSLQVFELAREAHPHDEEFLTAALLHDVGKAIDPRDPEAAALAALRGAITDRTAWLIEHLPDARDYLEKTLSPRARNALDASEHLEDLIRLEELDRAGRAPGAVVGTVEGALDYLRSMEDESYLGL